MVELSKCSSNTLLQRKEYKTKNNVGNREEEGIEGEGTEKICHRRLQSVDADYEEKVNEKAIRL